MAMATTSPAATSPLPKLTPTANPSGKLWMVMASANSQTFESLEDGPSGPRAG